MAQYEANPIGALQDRFQSRGIIPDYKFLSTSHCPFTFICQVTVGEITASGNGETKKLAKKAAAKSMLKILEDRAPSGGNDKTIRMMEKMGWKQGRGLGRDQQGIIQPIAAVGQVGCSGLGLNINVKGTKRLGRGRKGAHGEAGKEGAKAVEKGGKPTGHFQPQVGNMISMLQEHCMFNRLQMPVYKVKRVRGQPHQSIFTMGVKVGFLAVTGEGTSKKEAKREAATKMYNILRRDLVDDLGSKERGLCKTGVLISLQNHTSPEDQGDLYIQEDGNGEDNIEPTGQEKEVEMSGRDSHSDCTQAQIPEEELNSELDSESDDLLNDLGLKEICLCKTGVCNSLQNHTSPDENQGDQYIQEGQNSEGKNDPKCQKTEVETSDDEDQQPDCTTAEVTEEEVRSALNANRAAMIQLLNENQMLKSEVEWWSVHRMVEQEIKRDLIEEVAELRKQLFWQKEKSEMLEEEIESVRLENKNLRSTVQPEASLNSYRAENETGFKNM